VRIVPDTNVLVSAMLRQGSVPDHVVGLVLAGRCELVVDSRIVSEYRAVLARPEFGFDTAEVEALLAFVERSEWVVADPLTLPVRDEGDRAFIEVAVAGGAEMIVTGNVRDFHVDGLEVAVVTPKGLIERLSGR
jgi:putative PIN family toxin of toxin-antitoxin system